MAKQSYYEQLRDPRWQKKRLEIMERDGFRCRECDCETKTLNVHHGYYEKGVMVWEYPDNSLLTLCENCHRQFTFYLQVLNESAGRLPLFALKQLVGFSTCLEMNETDIPLTVRQLDSEFIYGFLRCAYVPPKYEDRIKELLSSKNGLSKKELDALDVEMTEEFYPTAEPAGDGVQPPVGGLPLIGA